VQSVIRFLHDRWVFRRRAGFLAHLLADLIPSNAKVLDIGCGNGVIGHLIQQDRPAVSVRGVEIMSRPDCLIDCAIFDGRTLPVDDSSVDVCMFVDVLHHTLDPESLLREAGRATKSYILIKDHLCESRADNMVLRFMDWVGNRPHGVYLPYNYQSRTRWERHFSSCGLRIAAWKNNLPLYPFPFSRFFGRNLHFIALLEKV
jgi:SAM-dependent methyltransferase